jgi:hypothetical protein
LDLFFVDQDQATREIHGQAIGLKDRFIRDGGLLLQSDTHTCQQFAFIKRFGEIITSACIERGDLILFGFMDRENDDGRLTPLAQMTRDFDTIKIR